MLCTKKFRHYIRPSLYMKPEIEHNVAICKKKWKIHTEFWLLTKLWKKGQKQNQHEPSIIILNKYI